MLLLLEGPRRERGYVNRLYQHVPDGCRRPYQATYSSTLRTIDRNAWNSRYRAQIERQILEEGNYSKSLSNKNSKEVRDRFCRSAIAQRGNCVNSGGEGF